MRKLPWLKKSLFLVLSVLLLLVGVASATAATAATPPDPVLDARLQAIMADAPDGVMQIIGLQVVAIKDGRVAYIGNFGDRYRDDADPSRNLPITTDTMYVCGSISKPVMTIGIMQQVEAGRIDLDADVSRYLGFRFRNPNYPNDKITARMLLSHTSSVRDGFPISTPATDRLSDFFLPEGKYYQDGAYWAAPGRNPNIDMRPGRYFSYANQNFGTLATILEAVTHQRFTRYMREHVLQPLGISGSWYVCDFGAAQIGLLGTLYNRCTPDFMWDPSGPWYAWFDDWGGHKVQPWQVTTFFDEVPVESQGYVPGTNATWQAPFGGLRISALDLTKIVRMLQNGGEFRGVRVLEPASVELMLTPAWTYDRRARNGDTWDFAGQWGLGVHMLSNNPDVGDQLLPTADSPRWVGHPGDAYGMISNMYFDPRGGDGYVYYCAGMGDDPYAHLEGNFFSFDRAIIDALFTEVFAD